MGWQNEYQLLSRVIIINGNGGCGLLAAYRRTCGSSQLA